MKANNLVKNICSFLNTRVLYITPLAVLTLGMITATVSNPVVSVYVDGEFVGTVAHYQDFESQMDTLESSISKILDQNYTLDVNPEYRLSYTKSNDFLTADESKEYLAAKVDEIETLAVIYVDGAPVVATETIQSAEKVLEEVLVETVGEEYKAQANFVENVWVQEEVIDVNMLKSEEEAKEYLLSSTTGESTHKVQPNQTLSGIANMYGMSSNDVSRLNPNIEPTTMQIGQEIVIEKAKPAVSVEVVKEQTYTVDVAYQTETTYDDSMTTSQKKTINKGVVGKNEVVAEVTYINGEEVSRKVISEEVLSEPKNAVVAVGTKKTVVTGNFKMPVAGARLTSPYGYRGSGFHTGVDLARGYGAPILASDGGTVIFAGWNGSYGNCVIIDHGNGITTLYAHNSSLSVSKGMKVSQGDQIASMGSTGASTGNHVHFEIRVNGKHVNPYNYLR